jgi:hypothetical protein
MRWTDKKTREALPPFSPPDISDLSYMLSFTDAVMLPIEQLSTCPEGRLQEAHCQEKEASVILSACRWCQHDKNPTCPYLSALWQPLTKRALSSSK